MKKLIESQKGSSKKQLTLVLNQKEGCENDLDSYLKEGETYLKNLDSKINSLKELGEQLKKDGSFKVKEETNDKKEDKKEEKPKSLAENKDTAATNDAFLKEFTSETPTVPKEQPKMLTQSEAKKTIEDNTKEWELKLQAQKLINEKKLKDTEENLKKQLAEKNIGAENEKKALVDINQKSLNELNGKYNELKTFHDKEVKQIFENVGTLKFVKNLRFFKG